MATFPKNFNRGRSRNERLPRPSSLAYAYDANGNMTSRAGRTIAYDGEDRPVSITSGGQTTLFVYGPDGRRLKKTTGGQTTLYLGADEEITPDGTNIKDPMSDVRKSDNEINWLHRDHLSSVKLMSNASGQIISENFFKPYSQMAVDFATNTPQTAYKAKLGHSQYVYDPVSKKVFVGSPSSGKIKTFYVWDGRTNDAVVNYFKEQGAF